jgi:hypothetical protein
MSRFRYKFIAVYILYEVCIQTSVSILCEPKGSRSDGACEVPREIHCALLPVGTVIKAVKAMRKYYWTVAECD